MDIWGFIVLHKQAILDTSIVITALGIVATLIWSMIVEFPKMRRRLSLISYEISRNIQMISRGGGPTMEEKWSRVEFAFSNTSRRPIKPISCNGATYSGAQKLKFYFYDEVKELHEGQHGSGAISCNGNWIEDDDLKSITITDSMNKEHSFYFYNGKLRKKWLWKVLYFLHVWR